MTSTRAGNLGKLPYRDVMRAQMALRRHEVLHDIGRDLGKSRYRTVIRSKGTPRRGVLPMTRAAS